MAGKRGINNHNLKEGNRGLLLKLIATGICSSRAELARHSGLSKMAVSNIITEFIGQDIIAEKEPEQVSGQGRNPITLCISQRAPKIIGVALHRDECVVVLADLNLNILKRLSMPVNEEVSAHLLAAVCTLIDQAIPAEERILGIGVGSVGPVDIKRGMILNPPNFYGIRNLAVTAYLYERYQLPVYLDSQYNCAALAEKYYGFGRDYHDFIFVGIMNGIGSGIISDERIFRNSNGLTSEIGHVSINCGGNKCSCGNTGCLETYAGTRVVTEKLRQITGDDKSFREFCVTAEGTEEGKVDAVFREMAEHLACALISTVNLLNAQTVIIGHEGYFIPNKYLVYLEEIINRQKLSGDYRHVKVIKSFFQEEAHLRGCVCGILNRVFEGKGFMKE